MKVLWQDHTFVMKCILNALCLVKPYISETYDGKPGIALLSSELDLYH